MKQTLKAEFYRLFHRKEFYLALAVGSVLSIWLLGWSVNLLNDHVEFLRANAGNLGPYYTIPSVFNRFIGIDHAALPTTILFTIFPILVSLPFATTYAEDLKGGYIVHYAVRVPRRQYFCAKFIVTFVSAVLVVAWSFFVSIFFTTMFIPEIMPDSATFTFPAESAIAMWSSLYRNHPYWYLLFYSLIDFVFYGAFATMILGLSAIIRSKYILLLAAEGLYFASGTVFSALKMYAWIPELFLRQNQMRIIESWMPVTVEILIMFAVGAVLFFRAGMKKNVL